MTTLQTLLARLKELDEKATQREWKEEKRQYCSFVLDEEGHPLAIDVEHADALLIAEYRNSTPLLVKVIEKLIDQRNIYFRAAGRFNPESRILKEGIERQNQELYQIINQGVNGTEGVE